jgi:hypothetical protein
MHNHGWLEHLLATAALWVRIQTSLKITKLATYSKQTSGQHTLVRQKIYKKVFFSSPFSRLNILKKQKSRTAVVGIVVSVFVGCFSFSVSIKTFAKAQQAVSAAYSKNALYIM